MPSFNHAGVQVARQIPRRWHGSLNSQVCWPVAAWKPWILAPGRHVPVSSHRKYL